MKKYDITATDEGMTIKVVNTHGGKRAGAGRKGFCENAVSVCWRVSEESRDWIANQANEQGVSKGVIIDELVRAFQEFAESE